MTDTYIKIPSTQGGPFTASNNLMDYRIPLGDSYDLQDSFLEFDCNVNVSNGANVPAGTTPIYSVECNFTGMDGGDNVLYGNEALIKNASLQADAVGKIEEVRRADVIYGVLKHNVKNEDSLFSESYRNFNSRSGLSGVGGGLFRELHGLGDSPSLNKNHMLKVKLSEFMESGNIENYSTQKYGRSLLHLELNLNKMNVVQRLATAGEWTYQKREDMDGITNGGGAPVNLTQLRTTMSYKDINSSPFFVNQHLLLSGTNAGGAPALAGAAIVITKIEYDSTGLALATTNPATQEGKLILTFTPIAGISIPAGGSYTALKVVGQTIAGGATFSLNNANLVLKKIMNPAPAPSISYTHYTTEEDLLPAGASFQKTYTMEPEAVNLFITFPNDVVSAINGLDTITYRIAVNNIDIMDRDIQTGSSEHKDMLNKVYQNQGRVIANLKDRLFITGGQDTGLMNDVSGTKQLLIAVPLPQTATPKLVSVRLTGNANFGSKNITLFKECFKSI